MKQIAILFCFIYLLFSGNAATQQSDKEQLIENKLRIDQLENQMEQDKKDSKEELKEALRNKVTDLEEKFEIQKEDLEYKRSGVDTWLTVIGIILTLFGIIVPVAGIFYTRKMNRDFDKQTKNLNADLDRIKDKADQAIESHIKESTSKLNKIIQNFQEHEKHVRNSKEEIDKLLKDSRRLTNTPSSNTAPSNEILQDELSSRAIEIKNQRELSPFENNMADLVELYFSRKYNLVIYKVDFILENYSSEINMDQLVELSFYKAHAYQELMKFENALYWYQKIIDLKADGEGTWNNMGNIYIRLGKFNEAVECFQKALKIKEDLPAVIGNLGRAFIQLKEFDKGYTYISKALEMSPNDPSSHYNFGVYYFEKGEYDKAISAYKEAIRLNNDYSWAYVSMGNTYAKQGKYKDAIESYKIAIEKDFTNGHAYHNLIEFLILLGQISEASEYLSEAKQAEVLYTDALGISILEGILSIINNTFEGTINSLISKIKQDTSGIPLSEWSFDDLKSWLSSEASSYLSAEQKQLISELIQEVEKWLAQERKKQ